MLPGHSRASAASNLWEISGNSSTSRDHEGLGTSVPSPRREQTDLAIVRPGLRSLEHLVLLRHNTTTTAPRQRRLRGLGVVSRATCGARIGNRCRVWCAIVAGRSPLYGRLAVGSRRCGQHALQLMRLSVCASVGRRCSKRDLSVGIVLALCMATSRLVVFLAVRVPRSVVRCVCVSCLALSVLPWVRMVAPAEPPRSRLRCVVHTPPQLAVGPRRSSGEHEDIGGHADAPRRLLAAGGGAVHRPRLLSGPSPPHARASTEARTDEFLRAVSPGVAGAGGVYERRVRVQGV